MEKKSFENIKCFICSTRNVETIFKGNSVHVSICKNDGLVYLTPRWSSGDYESYYSNGYDDSYRPEILKEESEIDKYSNAVEIYERLKNHNVASFCNMLDIGSGMGWALEYFSGQVGDKLSLHAIESSDFCVQHLRKQGRVNIVGHDVESNWQEANKEKFDFVLMRHVVEHFLDPVAALKKVAFALSSRGVAYIAVPNMMRPILPLEGYWFRPAHTYYFAPETLRYCAALAGLQCISVEETDTSEIWGIFEKATISPTTFKSVYKKQRSILDEYMKLESRKNNRLSVFKKSFIRLFKKNGY